MTARECALAAIGCGVAAYAAEVAGIFLGAAISSRWPWLAWVVGRTVPSRTSWLAWVIMYVTYCVAQYRAGARGSLWLAEEELAGAVVIWVLALRHGTGGALIQQAHHGKRRRLTADAWLLLGVCLTLAAWSVTRRAGLAVILLSVVELAATWPTVAKMRRLPGSEPMLTWVLVGAAGAWLVPATGAHADPVLYAYPAALMLSSLAVVAACTMSMPFAARGIPLGVVGVAGVVVPAVAIVSALTAPAAVVPQVFALPFGYPANHARPASTNAPRRQGVPHHRKRPRVSLPASLPGPGSPAPMTTRPTPPRPRPPAPRPSPSKPGPSPTITPPPPTESATPSPSVSQAPTPSASSSRGATPTPTYQERP